MTVENNLPIAYISIGSNIDPHLHIKNTIDVLGKKFADLAISSVYESESVGFEGPNFLNLMVSFSSHLSLLDLNQYLHALEDREGRERLNGKAWDSRTLDLDIILFGDMEGIFQGIELPRDEILQHAHVLWPLAELAADKMHSLSQQTCSELRRTTKFPQQKIWKTKL